MGASQRLSLGKRAELDRAKETRQRQLKARTFKFTKMSLNDRTLLGSKGIKPSALGSLAAKVDRMLSVWTKSASCADKISRNPLSEEEGLDEDAFSEEELDDAITMVKERLAGERVFSNRAAKNSSPVDIHSWKVRNTSNMRCSCKRSRLLS